MVILIIPPRNRVRLLTSFILRLASYPISQWNCFVEFEGLDVFVAAAPELPLPLRVQDPILRSNTMTLTLSSIRSTQVICIKKPHQHLHLTRRKDPVLQNPSPYSPCTVSHNIVTFTNPNTMFVWPSHKLVYDAWCCRYLFFLESIRVHLGVHNPMWHSYMLGLSI